MLLQSAQLESVGAVVVVAIVAMATAATAASASDAAAASVSARAQRKCSSAQRCPFVSQVHLRLLLLLLPPALLPPLPYRAMACQAVLHLAAQFFGKPRSPALLTPCHYGSSAPCDTAWLGAAPR